MIIFGTYFRSLCEDINKTGNTKHIATPQEEDRATDRDNMHRKFGEVWFVGSVAGS